MKCVLPVRDSPGRQWFAARDWFPDVIGGLVIDWEAQDYPAPAPMREAGLTYVSVGR